MNHLQEKIKFDTKEEGLKNLKEAVDLRDKMGGALYWNILNEDCCDIAAKVKRLGATDAEINPILRNGSNA